MSVFKKRNNKETKKLPMTGKVAKGYRTYCAIVLCMAFVMCLSVTAFAADETREINGVTYIRVNNNPVWWITGTYTGNATSLTLENRIDGQDVNCIHSAVFKNNQTLTKVTLPTNVRFYEIGNEAFAGCTDLESPDFSKWLCRMRSLSTEGMRSLRFSRLSS